MWIVFLIICKLCHFISLKFIYFCYLWFKGKVAVWCSGVLCSGNCLFALLLKIRKLLVMNWYSYCYILQKYIIIIYQNIIKTKYLYLFLNFSDIFYPTLFQFISADPITWLLCVITSNHVGRFNARLLLTTFCNKSAEIESA